MDSESLMCVSSKWKEQSHRQESLVWEVRLDLRLEGWKLRACKEVQDGTGRGTGTGHQEDRLK